MLWILAPFSGRVVPLDEVPDPVFAERMLGDGVAVDPEEGLAVAPVAGRVVVLHSASHAFAIETEEGVRVLVHIGLETVHLRGDGFERLVQEGDRVESGQPIVRFDLERIRAAGYSLLSPVVLPDLSADWEIRQTGLARVRAGRDPILMVQRAGL